MVFVNLQAKYLFTCHFFYNFSPKITTRGGNSTSCAASLKRAGDL